MATTERPLWGVLNGYGLFDMAGNVWGVFGLV